MVEYFDDVKRWLCAA